MFFNVEMQRVLLLDGTKEFVQVIHIDADIKNWEVMIENVGVKFDSWEVDVEQQTTVCVHHSKTDPLLGDLKTTGLDVILEQFDQIFHNVRIMSLAMKFVLMHIYSLERMGVFFRYFFFFHQLNWFDDVVLFGYTTL